MASVTSLSVKIARAFNNAEAAFSAAVCFVATVAFCVVTAVFAAVRLACAVPSKYSCEALLAVTASVIPVTAATELNSEALSSSLITLKDVKFTASMPALMTAISTAASASSKAALVDTAD